MRAAIEAAPYTHAKLSAVALISNGDFGARLDRAIARSEKLKVLKSRSAALAKPG